MKLFLVFSVMIMCCATCVFCSDPDSLNKNTDFFPVQAPPNTKLIVKNGNVFNGKTEMTYDEVLVMLKNKPECQAKYIKGMRLKNSANGMLGGGIAGIALGYALMLTGIETDYYGVPTYTASYYVGQLLSLIGGQLIIGSIPMKICGKNVVRRSIDMYNQPPPGTSRSNDIQYQFGFSNHGLSLLMNF